MSYILENLYLGGIDEACDTQKLRANAVTHILTLDIAPLPTKNHEGFVYKHVHALDMDTCDLLSKLPQCLEFVEEGRSAGGVLVHCYVGESRSAAVILAYIMHKLNMSLQDALPMVACQRPIIKPNAGFMEQLELFETMENMVDLQHQAYKQYRLSNLATQMQNASVVGLQLAGQLVADPSLAAQQVEPFYKCAKCRRPLFKQTSVLTHAQGTGEQAFTWHGRHAQQQHSDLCRKSLFVEPVQWMEDDLSLFAGKLSCPKCHSKLGSFIWSGERCCCGTWVTPAFQIQTSKVDLCRNIVAKTMHAQATAPVSRQPLDQLKLMDQSDVVIEQLNKFDQSNASAQLEVNK